MHTQATVKTVELLRTDSKRPDDFTLVPWRESFCRVFEVTVADNNTSVSYLQSIFISASSIAEAAATYMQDNKVSRITRIAQRYEFISVTSEFHGIYSKTSAHSISKSR